MAGFFKLFHSLAVVRLRGLEPAGFYAFATERPLQLASGNALGFGVARPLGNQLVWDVSHHAVLEQLNGTIGPI